MPDIAKLLIALGCILIVGAILLVIGIMGENISRLRNKNVELKGELQREKEKNAELEKRVKELSKYDKKYQRELKREEKQ